MALVLRQSTAVVISFGPFVDKTDGVTPEVGLVSAIDHATTGILLSKNGGALTIRSQAVTASTYDAYAMYRVTLSTTDTNTVGTLRMAFIETATCLPVWQDLQVVEEVVYDALNAAAAAGELAVKLSTQGKADVNAEVDGALDTAIPGVPTGDSINQRVRSMDLLTEAGGAGDLAAVLVDTGTTLDARIPAALVGGRMNADVGAKTGNVALSAQEKLDVNAEVVDVLETDTHGEPGQGPPGATISLEEKIGFLYKAFRNRITQTSTTMKLFGDDGTTVDQRAAVSDDGTEFIRGELATGP